MRVSCFNDGLPQGPKMFSFCLVKIGGYHDIPIGKYHQLIPWRLSDGTWTDHLGAIPLGTRWKIWSSSWRPPGQHGAQEDDQTTMIKRRITHWRILFEQNIWLVVLSSRIISPRVWDILGWVGWWTHIYGWLITSQSSRIGQGSWSWSCKMVIDDWQYVPSIHIIQV